MMRFYKALLMASLVFFVNGESDDKVHVAILSNRLTATAVTIGSVCRTSAKKIHFHVFSTDDQEFRSYYDQLADCQGSILELQSIDAATESLLDIGFEPVWWKIDQGMVQATPENEKEWGIQTPYKNVKHAHALNLLRFYLPHLPSLSGVDKFVFLDDDVVLQRDIEEVVNLETIERPGVAMTAGCQHWMWNGHAVGNFETSYNMSVLETGYMGNLNEVCHTAEEEQIYGCARDGLIDEIATISQLYDADSEFASHPLDRQAFNMGLNVVDVKEWKALGLSHRFEQWVDASNHLKMFPLDTLAFGLGLGYLALGDAVKCYEPGSVSHLVGMAFVSQEAFDAAGWPIKSIREEAYALHYNGANKPWENAHDESVQCESAEPASLIGLWTKACQDVGICKCSTVSDNNDEAATATARRQLQSGGRNDYTFTGRTNKLGVTPWLNDPESAFEVDAGDYFTKRGRALCGVYYEKDTVIAENMFKFTICGGPWDTEERLATNINLGMTQRSSTRSASVRAGPGAFSCDGNGILYHMESDYKGGERTYSPTCASYPGWITSQCYWSEDFKVVDDTTIKSECGDFDVMTGMRAGSTDKTIQYECCRWSKV